MNRVELMDEITILDRMSHQLLAGFTWESSNTEMYLKLIKQTYDDCTYVYGVDSLSLFRILTILVK